MNFHCGCRVSDDIDYDDLLREAEERDDAIDELEEDMEAALAMKYEVRLRTNQPLLFRREIWALTVLSASVTGLGSEHGKIWVVATQISSELSVKLGNLSNGAASSARSPAVKLRYGTSSRDLLANQVSTPNVLTITTEIALRLWVLTSLKLKNCVHQ